MYFNWIVLQVYKNKVISRYTDVSGLVDAVTELLTASQLFMRTKQVFTNFVTMNICNYTHFLCCHLYMQDECSFVSLRDVERAMIVFEWFYENNKFFEQLLKDEPGYEVRMHELVENDVQTSKTTLCMEST